MVNCKNCGAPLTLDSAFCPYCGTHNPEAQEHLEKLQQLDATKRVYESQKPDTQKQIAATRQQLQKARQEQQRYRELGRQAITVHPW